MSKTCAEIFSDISCTIIGNRDMEITGIAYDSRKVKPGDAFFCIVGLESDGHTYAQAAIDKGAKVLVVERKVFADATDVTEVVVSDSRKAMAHASANFYDNPSNDFSLVGITGTNGKTTTTYLVEHVARTAHHVTGMIGTVGTKIGDTFEETEHTTPESPDLQATFARMRDAHCSSVAMEVSSHALDLDRTWWTHFAVTAFTNLTQDHLDYHKTFEAYFEAKALLFSKNYPAKRVICIDDSWGKELLARCSARDESIITCGFERSAQIHPRKVQYLRTHTTVELDACGSILTFDYPLVGKFNVSNMMLAFGIGLALGIPEGTIVRAMETAPAVPGRLQRVPDPKDHGFSVLVDYAHTPDALIKAMGAVRAITEGRLIVVFGCGGNRDAAKRPLMGQAALDADHAIVTSDNPRHEKPEAIIEDIVAGMVGHEDRFEVVSDRGEAIRRAIELAKPGDSVLIAGKGHETYQLVGDEVLHFDDVEQAAKALADLA